MTRVDIQSNQAIQPPTHPKLLNRLTFFKLVNSTQVITCLIAQLMSHDLKSHVVILLPFCISDSWNAFAYQEPMVGEQYDIFHSQLRNKMMPASI